MAKDIKSSEDKRSDKLEYGKKFYGLLILLMLLILLCIANLFILAIMYLVLDISNSGMSSMSFFKDHEHIKWLVDGDFEDIMLNDGTIGGFSDEHLTVTGENQNVTFSIEGLLKSALSVTPEGTFIKTQQLKYVNPESKKSILDVNGLNHFLVTGEFTGKSMKTDAIRTPRIVSDNNDDLRLSSPGGKVKITGNEGLYVDSKSFHAQTEDDILIQVKDKASILELDGLDGGVRLNRTAMPDTRFGSGMVVGIKKYRLCACLKTGELFRAEVALNELTCAIAKQNPCPT